jgi:hypothetical protein
METKGSMGRAWDASSQVQGKFCYYFFDYTNGLHNVFTYYSNNNDERWGRAQDRWPPNPFPPPSRFSFFPASFYKICLFVYFILTSFPGFFFSIVFIFKWHTNDVRQAHKMPISELGVRHLYAI